MRVRNYLNVRRGVCLLCLTAGLSMPLQAMPGQRVELSFRNGMYTLTANRTSVGEVLRYIERNSDYVVVYDKTVRAILNQQLNITLRGRSIPAIVKELCSTTGMNYSISGKQISLSAKHAKRVKTPQRQSEKKPDNMKTIKGTITEENGLPLIGATVVVDGTHIATVTDTDGHYELEVPQGSHVTISYIGFNPKQFSVDSGSNYDFSLKEDDAQLNEVVVIGYGQMRKKDLTGSVNTFQPDQLNKGAQSTAQEALIGKIPGVNVITNSGAPGSGSTIRIRSGASLSASNDPLIVIDGVPVDNSTIEGSSNIIGAINPNDIETFTVLKDASATAIYGSRASNGVIVITTKKGSNGKLRINYNANLTISSVAKRLDPLTADEFREAVPNISGVPSNVELGTYSTDWQDEIYRTAVGTEHNLSISGSIKNKAPYRVSGGYTNQQGVIRENSYERFTFSGNISPSFLNDHLTFNANLKASFENNHPVDNSVVGNALTYDPTRPVKTGSATASTDPGLGYFIWMNGDSPMAIQTDNPVAQLELQDVQDKVYRTIGNLAVDYKVHGFEDLALHANFGMDLLESKYKKEVPDLAGTMYTSNLKDGTGLNYHSKQKKHNYLIDLYTDYNHLFGGKHKLNAMLGYGWQHFWKQFDDTSLSPEGEEIFTPSHSESEYYLLSLYGRANYTYDNRYLITATLRADASSRFAKGNRWGWFPSVALAWRISEEKFLRDNPVLSNLKLRLSYGETGQQDILNDYPYLSTYSRSYDDARYLFGDTWYNTYRPNAYDPDIKWETTSTWNVGLDYGFLNNRIYGSLDLYWRHTKNLLNTINVISGTNFAPVFTTNIGTMNNRGVEFAINAIPVQNKDWKWDIGFNYTWNTSEITKLNTFDSESNFVQTGFISGTGKYVQVFMVGKRPYTFYLCKQAYDDNGKPIEGQYIQPDGSVGTNEARYATNKSALPKSYIGFNTTLTYRNWQLSMAGHGAFGAYVYNYVRANQYLEQVYSDQGNFSNILKSTLESGFQTQQLYSDYFLEKGDFFRMDNISLAYNFPHLWNKSSSLRLGLSVQNVFTITGYDGVDPEIASGIDREMYPRPRSFTINANLTF